LLGPLKHRLADEADPRVDLVLACGDGIAAAADDDAQVVDVCVVRRVCDARGGTGVGGLPGGRAEQQGLGLGGKEGKEYYMHALTKPHGSCRGSSGSDMHKKISRTKTET
jgi:hypothetical protein